MQQGFRKAMYFNDGKLHDLVTYVWSMQIVTINHFVIAVQRHYKPFFFYIEGVDTRKQIQWEMPPEILIRIH